MSTLATYGLFSDWYYEVPPSGERVYWAIPMGHLMSSDSDPEILYNVLSQGTSVGNERAVYHEKVTGYINAEPFYVGSRKYASSFHFSGRAWLGNYNGVRVYGHYSKDIQVYEDGLIAVTVYTVDEGFEFKYKTCTERCVCYWSFNGANRTTSQDYWFESYDGEPERETGHGTSRRTLSGYWTGRVEMPVYNFPAIIANLLHEHPCQVNFDNLVVEAADQMHYTANNVDNVRQFADVTASLVQLLTGHAPKKVLKRILHGTSSPRAFGRELKELSQSAWLTNRYVVNTTKSDVEDFLDKIGSVDIPPVDNYHIIRAGESKGNWSCHVKIRTMDKKQNSLAEAHRWAMQHGLGVTPANLWDMIPFSFMVDWFIPVGETLKTLDTEFYFHSAYYEILSYTASRKFTMDVSDGGNILHVTVYSREVSDRVPVVSNLTYEDPSSNTVRNRIIDASAIFL